MYFKKKTGQTLETTNFILLGFLSGFVYLFYKKMYKHSLFLLLLVFILLMFQRTILKADFINTFSPAQGVLFYLFLHIITNGFQILYVVLIYKNTEYFYKAELDYVEILEEEFLKLHYKEVNHIFGILFKLIYYFFGFLIYLVASYYLFTFLLSEVGVARYKVFFQFCFYLSVLFFAFVILTYLKLFVGEVLRFVKVIRNFKK